MAFSKATMCLVCSGIRNERNRAVRVSMHSCPPVHISNSPTSPTDPNNCVSCRNREKHVNYNANRQLKDTLVLFLLCSDAGTFMALLMHLVVSWALAVSLNYFVKEQRNADSASESVQRHPKGQQYQGLLNIQQCCG